MCHMMRRYATFDETSRQWHLRQPERPDQDKPLVVGDELPQLAAVCPNARESEGEARL